MEFIKSFEQVSLADIALVGGKNGSLGEMIQNLAPKGITIPSGFVITSHAYLELLKANKLEDEIKTLLRKLDKTNLDEFAQIGKTIRTLIKKAPLPENIVQEIEQAYATMEKRYGTLCDVAVRSSATAEDLPEASFAGQQETFLNIRGTKALLSACTAGFSSLFTDRAMSYRIDHGFDHMKVALSLGVQKMVRSDLACSGVMFTLDTESGCKDVVFINAAYGLGENIVKGVVNPDEFYVHKPTLKNGFKPILKKRLGSKRVKLTYNEGHNPVKNIHVPESDRKHFSLNNAEILKLAKQAVIIEDYYSQKNGFWTPMDIEWAKDGNDGQLYIVQARPETVHALKQEDSFFEEYFIKNREQYRNKIILTGKSIGRKIVTGTARVIPHASQMNQLKPGEILVTDLTDPDWEPIMKRAGGIITNRGGRTCHAAIISRELGIPAVIGTNNGTETITSGQDITLDCSGGEVGVIFDTILPFEKTKISLKTKAQHTTNIMMNVGNPDEAFNFAKIPNDGVGLARLEFIINSAIQIHPMALVHPEKVTNSRALNQINALTAAYNNKKQYFIDKLAEEAGTIAAAFYPKPVIIRLSDFKSNEYRNLIGGEYFEPVEENPMIGFRGASRYYHPAYKEAFALECLALKKIREEMGLTNVKVMIPFVRTIEEGKAVIQEMKTHDLLSKDLEIYMMCEIPSNVLLIDQFSAIFDGFSIGSNDLTQMTLAVDRDSSLIAPLFDERNEAVKKMIALAIDGAKRNHKKIGICGQAPSDYPELAKFLVDLGIDSLSLNPDAVLKEIMALEKNTKS